MPTTFASGGHIHFDTDRMILRLLDQRALPAEKTYIECASLEAVIEAIRNMTVRGAPAIGVTAAWGSVLAAWEARIEANWQDVLHEKLNALEKARPTAVNLLWAVERLRENIASSENADALLASWLRMAAAMQREDIEICQAIGRNGARLVRDGDTVLTHCNAGALATAGYGTALGVIRAAVEQGKRVKVIADETRPLFQGSRLTAYELAEDGIDVIVACDNACALLMQQGLPSLVITGADRIAANGDTANKIGTCGVAIMARYYNIPFYIAAPLSTFDMRARSGADIPIEQRDGREVSSIGSIKLAPDNVQVCNFAFDVTTASLINAFITEKGLIYPPYRDNIAAQFKKESAGGA